MPGYQTHCFTQQSSWDYRRHASSDSKVSSPLWLNTTTDGVARAHTCLPPFNIDPPFTPCLTPTSSIGESSASSPRFTVTPCEEERKPFPRVQRMYRSDVDVHSSDSNGRCSTSPLLSEASFSLKESSTPFIMVNKSSSSHCGDPRPTKKARSAGSSLPTHSPAASIPESSFSDVAFDSVTKASSARPSSIKSASSSRRRKGGTTSETTQPIKFRFVSVQHSAVDPKENASGATDEDDQRIHLEEHMEEEVDNGPFEHGPTEFPPRSYQGGEHAVSPLQKKKTVGKIPASNLDFLPVLEARFQRLEVAIEKYVEHRGQQALRNSRLPSSQSSSSSPASNKSTSPRLP